MISFERGIERAIEVSVEIASAVVAWFKLLTTNPAASSPTQGTTTFTRASAANYIDSTGVLRSAAVDTPRYQAGGLLIEQASTNMARYSEDLTFTTVTGMTVSPSLYTAPDGLTTMDGVVENGVATRCDLYWSPAAITSGTTMTNSVFISKTGRRYWQIGCGAFANNFGAVIDTLNGVITSSGANGTNVFTSAKVEDIGGAWRVSITGVLNFTVPYLLVIATDSPIWWPGTVAIIPATNTTGIWGAQVEAGSTATSYIKTLGTAATRAADKCYTANANIPNLTSGAEFVWTGALPDDGSFHTAFRSSPNHTIIRRSWNGHVDAFVGGMFIGAAVGVDTAVHTYTLRTNGSNLHELLVDGVVVVTKTTTGLLQPTAPLYIGSANGYANSLNGATQSFAMYGKALVAWFKLLTTDPAASSPTQGTTSFSRASSGTAVDANGLLVSYAANVPRQQDGGLLIEQASTNLCLHSQDFPKVAWNKFFGCTVPVAASPSPDGTLNATTVTFDGTPSGQLNQNIVGLTVGVTYTLSVYIKNTVLGATFTCIRVGSGGIPPATWSPTDTWTRQTATFTATATSAIFYFVSSAVGSMDVWGAQVEESSKATSYIKTLAAPVTRAADICYTATANIPTLANGATFVWTGAIPNDGGYNAAFRSSPTHTILRRMPNGDINTWIGGIMFVPVVGIDTAVHTYALRTNGINLHELLIDGVVVVTSQGTGLMQPTTRLNIGSMNGNTNYLNDAAQSFTMYDTALTDAEIQGL